MAGGGIKINNIKVSGGADGKTPVFNIEDGYLFNSYDNGKTWHKLGKVKGEDGVDGEDGATGAKLVSQVLVGQDASGGNIYKQTFDDGTTAIFIAPKGEQGEQGEAGKDGAISVQYITDIDKILDDPYTLPTGTFDPVFPYIYLAYTTSSKTSYALYQYDPTEKTLTFLDNIRENVLYYVANGEKKGIYYALRSPFNLLRPLTITKGEFESLKESITATKNELQKNIDAKNFAGYSMESEKTYDCVKGGALDRRLKKIEQALKNNL